MSASQNVYRWHFQWFNDYKMHLQTITSLRSKSSSLIMLSEKSLPSLVITSSRGSKDSMTWRQSELKIFLSFFVTIVDYVENRQNPILSILRLLRLSSLSFTFFLQWKYILWILRDSIHSDFQKKNAYALTHWEIYKDNWIFSVPPLFSTVKRQSAFSFSV